MRATQHKADLTLLWMAGQRAAPILKPWWSEAGWKTGRCGRYLLVGLEAGAMFRQMNIQNTRAVDADMYNIVAPVRSSWHILQALAQGAGDRWQVNKNHTALTSRSVIWSCVTGWNPPYKRLRLPDLLEPLWKSIVSREAVTSCRCR